MKRKWFYRLLLSYAPILLLIVLALIVFFYLKWNAETKVRMQNTNELFASHVVSVLDSPMKTIERFVVQQMLTDERVQEYLYSTDPATPYEVSQISERLTNMKTLFPITGDVYLYKTSADEVITTSALFKSGTAFADREFLRRAMDGGGARWSAPRSFRQFEAEAPTEVVSLVKRVPVTSAAGKGLIVVNVQIDAVRRSLQTINRDAPGYLALSGALEEPIYAADEPMPEEWELSGAESSYTGWHLSAGIPQSDARLASIFLNTWALPTLAVILLGILVLTYVTHRNYKPIEQIMMQLDRYTLKRSLQIGRSDSHNEFHFISTALDNLMERSNEFEARHRDDLMIRKRYWFYELLDGNFSLSGAEWKREAQELGLPDAFDSTLVAVTVLDNRERFDSAYSKRDQTLLKFVVQGVWDEICGNHGMKAWSEWKEDEQLCSILYLGERSDAASVLRVAGELKDWVENNLQFTVSLYLGTTAEGSEEIPRSYLAALQAGQYRTVHGYNRIYPASEWRLAAKGDLHAHLTAVKRLVQAIRAADAGWTELLHSLFANIKRDELPRERRGEIIGYLFYLLDKESEELPEKLRTGWTEALGRYPSAAIQSRELNDDMEHSLLPLLRDLADAVRRWREADSGSAPVEQIVDYLNREFANSALSLDHLGDVFGMSPRAVSKLFKAGTGIRFVDYVMELRMKKAELLLRETGLPVQTVGEQVGYPQVISFIRTFKRYAGVTPGEYRKLPERP
ncbi:helix-turn-helix domain-containing protein [Saccharibacillus sp. CPCC 101409]|uniref:helix-turn-helix domain-containing protein n=1 Tax=Saccharibacillus sp. CPCC 101409 TaxID=3058041 RepID=UPI002672CCFB|nr:helix-turn-helix domain-containing protein [Saccharibacillus sp. CPCC 101409]MDO3408685.1 helix-turn-helix domain-containing protein [Saccharibacillus sp. CPCC 101409]